MRCRNDIELVFEDNSMRRLYCLEFILIWQVCFLLFVDMICTFVTVTVEVILTMAIIGANMFIFINWIIFIISITFFNELLRVSGYEEFESAGAVAHKILHVVG